MYIHYDAYIRSIHVYVASRLYRLNGIYVIYDVINITVNVFHCLQTCVISNISDGSHVVCYNIYFCSTC